MWHKILYTICGYKLHVKVIIIGTTCFVCSSCRVMFCVFAFLKDWKLGLMNIDCSGPFSSIYWKISFVSRTIISSALTRNQANSNQLFFSYHANVPVEYECHNRDLLQASFLKIKKSANPFCLKIKFNQSSPILVPKQNFIISALFSSSDQILLEILSQMSQ